MTTTIASIALSGLKAAQAGLAVTANNISNQGTPGYSRQELLQQSSFSNFSGNGYYGQGADLVTVRRAYDDYLAGQATQSSSTLSYLNTYAEQVGNLMNRLGNVDSGVDKSLSDFYAALGAFAEAPGSTTHRQGALASAEALAARLRTVGEELSVLRSGSDRQIAMQTDEANRLARSIADLNVAINGSTGGVANHTPNDLLDKRDALVRQLANTIGITTSQQGTSVNIALTNGHPLVVGGTASQLVFEDDRGTAQGATLSLDVEGRRVTLRETDVGGGKIGALLQFRSGELATAEANLGQLAIALASAANSQQQFGLDADGAAGQVLFGIGAPRTLAERGSTGDAMLSVLVADTRPLTGSNYRLSMEGGDYVLTRLDDGAVFDAGSTPPFTVPGEIDGLSIDIIAGSMADGDSFLIDVTGPAAAGFALSLTDPRKLAGASPMALEAEAANTGTGVPGMLRSTASGTVDYASPVTVVFTSPTVYELRDENGTGIGGGTLTPPSTTIGTNGWAFDLSGTPAAGDRFTVRPDAASPSGDNRNALALASLGTAKLVRGATLTDHYGSLVSGVGTRGASLNVAQSAQQAAFQDAVAAEQSLVGVNMEEEGARLIRYQNAYAAAGKVLAVASSLFEQLLAQL